MSAISACLLFGAAASSGSQGVEGSSNLLALTLFVSFGLDGPLKLRPSKALGVQSVQSVNPLPEILSNPGVLPGNGDVLVIASEGNVSAVAIRNLHRLVLGIRDGDGCSNPRTRLPIGTSSCGFGTGIW
jgi:hypothetical protein